MSLYVEGPFPIAINEELCPSVFLSLSLSDSLALSLSLSGFLLVVN